MHLLKTARMGLVDNIEEGPDTFSILLTTDNHVGYNENDPIRGDDGWKTFNEVLRMAAERDVDMVVQGGDLFHINKPTKKSLYQVIKSLRLYCMGDRPCEMELLSDPSICLDNGFNNVNYEDPNLNISIPVFAISGNHDDATGDGLLSPLDVLSVSGLINHFGKVIDNENITVSPLLFQKGTTKLALYGMANVRDERLHRAFRDGLVKFQRPNIQTDQWFNLFCFHQNHAQHTFTSSIPESFLPNFLDLILWGHEHESIPFPVHNPEMGFDVLQAGSSVATSLSEGEVADKNAFILKVKGQNYSIEPIKLKSVRPFVMKEIELLRSDLIPGAASGADVIAYLADEVERAIITANQKYKENNADLFADVDDPEFDKKNIPLPLVRLRVEYSGGYEIENARRFSNRFVGKIANVNDVIQFYKKRSKETATIVKKTKFEDKDLFEEGLTSKKTTELQLTDFMTEFLNQAELVLIPEAGLNHAVKRFVENEDKHILDQFIKAEIEKESEILLKINIDEEEFHGDDEAHAKNVFKQVLNQVKRDNSARRLESVEIDQPPKKPSKKLAKSEELVLSDSDEEMILEPTKPNSRARTSKMKAKSKNSTIEVESDSGSESEEIISKPKPRSTRVRATKSSTRGGRGKKATLKDDIMNF